MGIREDFVATLKARERVLQQNMGAIKAYRAETDLIRQTNFRTDAGVMGLDKVNALTAKLREVKAENDELSNEVRYVNIVSTAQKTELERIDG